MKGFRFKSIQHQYIFLTSILILVLTAPILISGIYLINKIIYSYSKKLMKIELNSLIQKAERRYNKLKRFGLEDSEYHLKEIKKLTLEDYKNFKFEKTGKVFVIKKNGKPILFFDNRTYSLIKKLKRNKNGLLEFNFKNHSYLIYYTYYPRWKSYIGIYVDKNEIFHSKYIFVKLIILAFCIGLIIALFIIKFIRKRIISPIISLTEFSNKIKNGNLNAKLYGKFYYEFEQLKRAITVMVVSLKNMIEAYKRQLEIIKKREREIIEEKEKLTTTLKSINEGVIAADKNGKVLFMNSTAEKLTGYSFKEVLKINLCRIFVLKNHITTKELMQQVIDKNKNIKIEKNVYLIDKKQKEKPINLTASPLKNDKGITKGAVIVFDDITELLKIEEEISKIEKLQTIGVLAGGIAHDFNNLLGGIIGNLELLKIQIKKLNLNHNIMERINKIENASSRAQDLAYQLLTFSKGGDPVKKRTSLKNLIIDNTEFILRGSDIKLEFNIPDELWDVEVDPGQISQVIQNIVLNSKEAISGNGIIKIDCKNIFYPNNKIHPHWIEVKIEDNGPGIPDEIKNKIFDPFFTTKKTGTGLGLSICHSIITKHGGTIEIDSNSTQGTIVRILIPATGNKKLNKMNQDHENNQKKLNLKKLRVLIIDDNDYVREVLKDFITILGHNALTVSTGEEGIELYKEKKFDLVITDLTIPGSISGDKIAKEILKINKNAKIIVSSGYSDNSIMSEYKKFGFVGVLKKPVKLIDLKHELEKIFNK